MQLPKIAPVFNRKIIESTLRKENKFISDLLSLLPLRAATSQPDDDVLLDNSSNLGVKQRSLKVPNKTTSRAKSLVELQARLTHISSKKGLSYKEKLLKKNLKAKLKKKDKKSKINTKGVSKIKNEQTVTENKLDAEISEAPTTSNSDNGGRIVFSKFDFADLGKKKGRKEKHDPQHLLKDLHKQKQKLDKLRESGEVEKVIEIKEKSAWKNALARAQGEKVKDDEQLLMKTIKRDKQQRKKSKQKWEARQEGVKKAKDERQKKRQDNIDIRKKAKKNTKLKKAAKRGRIIPGM